MRRANPPVSAACALLLTVTSTGVSVARSGYDGHESERMLANGAAIVSVRSGDTTVRFIGSQGSGVGLTPNGASVRASITTSRPKSKRDTTAYGDAGRSVVDDLAALGMPRDQAEREFGDLQTLDTTASVPHVLASGGAGAGYRSIAPAAALTPYDTQCASINVASGKISGYGCSTFFLVQRDGNDWWLATKMKVSAHSSDESWFAPKRLTKLGWRASWAGGNILHDWDPHRTRAIDSCLTLTVKSSSPFAEVAVEGTVCPDSLGPWSVTAARSGGIWKGMERGTDYEGAMATQAVHSPPGAPVSYQSAWTLSYCDLWCN